jgi:hypothetical protein
MHAFIISSKKPSFWEEKTDEILSQNKASKYPFELLTIENVRRLEKFTRLSHNKKMAVIITSFENASIPAQNAFLKSLEEPQENILFILLVSSENLLLPTVLSRALLIKDTSVPVPTKKDIFLAKKFFSLTTSEKLHFTSKITSRQDAIEFTTTLIIGSQADSPNPSLILKLEAVQQALFALKKNANHTLQLTNMCLQIEQNDI